MRYGAAKGGAWIAAALQAAPESPFERQEGKLRWAVHLSCLEGKPKAQMKPQLFGLYAVGQIRL